MVSETYAPQFEVKSLEMADSRSICHIMGKDHGVLLSQIRKLGLPYEEGMHLCIRLSGKSFQSSCIRMKRIHWLQYFICYPTSFRKTILKQLESGVKLENVTIF